MKKTLLLLFFIFSISFVYGQYIDESFEGGWPPTDWLVVNNGSGNDWTLNTTLGDSNTGSNSAKYGYDSANAADTWLFTKGVTLAASEVVNWEFYEKVASATYPENLKFTVGTAQTVASQTTTLIDLPGLTNTGFIRQSGTFTAPSAGIYYFAFNCYSDADKWNLFVDDVLIETPPACPAPIDQTVTFQTSTSADLGWTENGTATIWDIEWETTGFAQGSGNMVTGTTTNPQTLTGLTVHEVYDFYVRADCGGGSVSSWTGPFTWTQPDVGDDCSLPIDGTVVADCSAATPLTLDFSNAISEELTSCDGAGNYGYWVKVTTPASGALKIFNSGTGIGLAIYDACGGSELYCNNNSLGAELSLSGFAANTDYYFYFWRDSQAESADICFEEITCLFPTNLSTTNILANSADLNWDAGGSETSWNIEYGPEGFTLGTGTTIPDVTINPYNLTGLTQGTSYDWYIQADCAASGGTGQSDWSGPSTFTTFTPPPPNDLCSGAYVLTVGNGACFDPVTSTNVGATDSYDNDSSIPAPGCASYSGGDLWFSVVVPASGDVVIESSVTDGFTDSGIAAYSGSCNNLALIECNDDGNDNPGTELMSRLDLTGQTAGETIFIRVWEYGNNVFGNFAVCAWEPMDAVVSDAGDGNCEDGNDVEVSHDNGNTYTWVPLVDANNNIIAYIFPNGNELGNITPTVYRNTSGTIRTDAGGIPYMDRDVQIDVATQPSGSDPLVRIVYLSAEITALINADATISSIDDMNFTKTENDCAGWFDGQGTYIAQTSNDVVNTNDSYIQCTVGDFSTFYVGREGYVIPLKLGLFSGFADEKSNVLEWTTFTEVNTSKFIVERSELGKEWNEVASLDAAGDSRETLEYTVVDESPLNSAYYRLRTIDFDGRSSLSDVILITRVDNKLRVNSIYPNPNKGSFVLNVTTLKNENTNIRLINTLGVTVYTKELSQKGGSSIESINVNNLPNGVYTLILAQNNNSITKRIVINR